ncbi:MAG: hypothetical protein WD607_06340 [Candidatus Paceibacterota bacterium]
MGKRQTIPKNGKESPAAYRKSLRSIGRRSARSAVRENEALGLPVTYMNRGRVIKESPSGRKAVIAERKAPIPGSLGVSKGDVIHVKKG